MVVGEYELGPEIASGGMATVLLGRRAGARGEVVAIKRIHPHLAKDPTFVNMFRDEARLARAIDHPNVVRVIELCAEGDDLFLALEYVEGVTLHTLCGAARRRGERVPDAIVSAVGADLLAGLQSAHEACDASGRPLEIVHRDVSPQNLLLGADGTVKLTDFGVAKAVERLQTTREGQVKGKIAYMAPEQLISDQPVDRRVDLYAAGAVLYELVTLRRLFEGAREPEMMMRIITGAIDPPSEVTPCDTRWDDLLSRALAISPEGRPPSAAAMAEALTAVFPPATSAEVGAWARRLAGDELGLMQARRERFADEATDVAESSMPRPRRRRAGLGAVAVASAIGLVAVAMRTRAEPPALRAALAGAIPVLPTAPALPLEASPRERVEVAESDETHAGEKVVAAPRPPMPKAPPTTAKTDARAAPFFTDQNGVRRVRRECL